MRLPSDLATWLAILALILTIPLNFFSSWAYPRVQNWWATRSRKSLQKRIDKLQTALDQMLTSVSMTDEWVLLAAERLASIIYWGVAVLAMSILLVGMPPPGPLRARAYIIVAFVSIFLGIYRVFVIRAMSQIQELRRYTGFLTKVELKDSIAKLTAKLKAREGKPQS